MMSPGEGFLNTKRKGRGTDFKAIGWTFPLWSKSFIRKDDFVFKATLAHCSLDLSSAPTATEV